MKIFRSKPKNIAYFFYRLISPIFDPINFFLGVKGYFWYVKDLFEYKIKAPKTNISILNLFPILNEKTQNTSFNAHYFFHPIWAFDRVTKINPKEHVDIASDYRFAGYLSRYIKTTFIDIRPIKTSLGNLIIKKGDALKLPYSKNSIISLSCLHVIEHIGLGRYGDSIDPDGTIKACQEFKRALKEGGLLYLAIPIGKEKIYFNAHRVFSPLTIINYCQPLKLKEFSVITDAGKFIEHTIPSKYINQNYACGLYVFQK